MLQFTTTTPANNKVCISSSSSSSSSSSASNLSSTFKKKNTEAPKEELHLGANYKENVSLEERIGELEMKLANMSQLVSKLLPSGETSSIALSESSDLSPSESKTPLSWAPSSSLDSPPVASMRRRIPQVVIHEYSNGQHLTCPILENNHKSEEKKDEGKLEPTKENASTVKSTEQKWMDYLESVQESTPDVDLQMEEFVRVPSQLEYLLNFGFLICIDSFLYVLTVLPLRFVWSLLLMLCAPWTGHYKFHRRHFYTVIQIFIILFTFRFVLVPISIGHLYHWIRGQAMLKLYVLIAIVEVFDRLMCCMGQDCLDSMYWNTTRRPRSMRMLVSVTVVMIYVICHTLILFVHVATLNVAINSADHALLTVLISGNFAEIKSTVFKKYNKSVLFKITASDICERFKLGLFLTLILMLNLCQGIDFHSTIDYLIMCGYVWAAELLSDWIKHSFITKFNFIPSKVYGEYALLLAGDVTGIGHEGVNMDRTHAVVKRIGFAQIPLVCVMLRLLTEAGRYYTSQYLEDDNFLPLSFLALSLWIALFGIKLSIGHYLQRYCAARLESAPELTMSPKKKKQ